MTGWESKSGALATTADKFGGQYLNRISQLLTGNNIASTDVTLKPLIGTDWVFQYGNFFLKDATNTNSIQFLPDAQGANTTLQLPTQSVSPDYIVLRKQSEELENKTIDFNKNTLSNLPAVADGSITTAKIADSAVTGAKIAAGTITTADISASAAIDYSKLNLAGQLMNADINASAAIVKSKLANLAIVDADIATGAAIAKSKLAALAIVDADIAAGAAIAKSKLAALNIVNTDVSSGAAIAYSKLNLANSIANTDLNAASGQPYQVPQINSAGTAVGYADPYMLPSSGRLYGVRGGWTNSGSGYTVGTGLLNVVVQGNGTGSTMLDATTSTDGNYCQMSTGANISTRAGWWTNSSVMRKFNPRLRTRFRINTAWVSGQGILYIGFVSSTAQPTAATSVLNTYLDTNPHNVGVVFGFRSTDSHWMIISNNAQGTATYTDTGLGTPDTTVHTLDIRIVDSPAAIKWSFDGVAQTDITDTTNCVPPSTTGISPIFIYEAQTANNIAIFEHWTQLSMDWA